MLLLSRMRVQVQVVQRTSSLRWTREGVRSHLDMADSKRNRTTNRDSSQYRLIHHKHRSRISLEVCTSHHQHNHRSFVKINLRCDLSLIVEPTNNPLLHTKPQSIKPTRKEAAAAIIVAYTRNPFIRRNILHRITNSESVLLNRTIPPLPRLHWKSYKYQWWFQSYLHPMTLQRQDARIP